MIFDSIQNKDNYKDFPLLYQALCYLTTLSVNDMQMLRPDTVLVKDKLFCNPVSLLSRPEDECIYEAHRKYIDLHFIISGMERIATADITALNTIIPYDESKDVEFLTGAADGYYDLKPGQFIVCFPNDSHKVGVMANGPVDIHKIVFKIGKDV